MQNNFIRNCCDGLYNSFDIHFTSDCDNKCRHCIDNRFYGLGVHRPNVEAIIKTINENKEGVEDVLFLGGEPCLYLEELYECVKGIKKETDLKVFITTSVPKICYDNKELFLSLLDKIDGINFSVQHYKEEISDKIRNTKSKFDRQEFYKSLPKEKIRINLNIVKPFLYLKDDLIDCLKYYDGLGFNSIKLSEIQHGKECFVSFEDIFKIKLKSPFYNGCQQYIDIDIDSIIPNFKTPLLLKRSCFMCEESLKASLMDGVKVLYKAITPSNKNKYGVIYGNGKLTKNWI